MAKSPDFASTSQEKQKTNSKSHDIIATKIKLNNKYRVIYCINNDKIAFSVLTKRRMMVFLNTHYYMNYAHKLYIFQF